MVEDAFGPTTSASEYTTSSPNWVTPMLASHSNTTARSARPSFTACACAPGGYSSKVVPAAAQSYPPSLDSTYFGVVLVLDGKRSVAIFLPLKSARPVIRVPGRASTSSPVPPATLAMHVMAPPSTVALTAGALPESASWARRDSTTGTTTAMPPAVEMSTSRPCAANSPRCCAK